MKTYYKLLAVVVAGGFMASCAENDIQEYVVEKPSSIADAEWLLEYGNIKDGIDRDKYPNFKLGCALSAEDYINRGIVFRVGNSNFDEITLGNAMKYGSVVDDEGNYNFGTITDFLDATDGMGVSVYGHTLAWHAQQNVTYLNSLLADVAVPIGPEDRIPDFDIDFADCNGVYPFSQLHTSIMPTIEDGILKATISKKTNRFYLAENVATEPGESYEIVILWRCSLEKITIPVRFGDANSTLYKLDCNNEWNTVKARIPATMDVSSLILDPGLLRLDVEISTVSIGHYPPDHRALSEEEKKENLVNEMNSWATGMMDACAGRVQAWDLINEAISGGGNVDGYYDLQHAEGGSADDFFWQDYLGSENYGPIAEAAARKAYAEAGGNPADLKLFVNDYNLESDWDNNKKLKSLIYWVGVWEKGGAKIDGLSSQMHISYYEDPDVMKSKTKHYINMLKLMVETGKLVRISELDMGYVDAWGNDVPTIEMNEQQLQNMANYYRYIIQMYLKIVPPAQQYGICQWCLTDAPAGSGWRAGSPVGLWTEKWQRKAAYAAFCEAFTEPIPDTEDFYEYLKAIGEEAYVSE